MVADLMYLIEKVVRKRIGQYLVEIQDALKEQKTGIRAERERNGR